MRRFFAAALAVLLLFSACACSSGDRDDDKGVKIVCTSFVQYDWARTIAEGSGAQILLLADNGADMHSYLPTARDIVDIASADLFIYCGGSSEKWAEDILATSAKDTRSLCMMELAELMHEEHIEGMEESHHDHDEEEYDEHVWLSLRNAETICRGICEALCEADGEHALLFEKNSQEYIDKIDALEESFLARLGNCSGNTLLFAGRFPFTYLLHDYDIDYYAAFEGCSAETEASFETVAFLAKKADELSLKYEIVIEGDDEQLAHTIAQSTDTAQLDILYLDALQSANKEQLDAGMNYLDEMSANFDTIIEALK